MEKERRNEMYGEVITGYVVYITFILVLISLMNYLFPTLTSSFEIIFDSKKKNHMKKSILVTKE